MKSKLSHLFRRAAVGMEGAKWFVLAGLTFRVFLELGYRYFVSPVFEYSGFSLDVNWLKYAESWVIYLVLLWVFPNRLEKASDFLMAYLLFYFLTPLLVFYALSGAAREHLYIVLFGVSLLALVRRGRPIKLPLIRGGRSIGYALLGISVISVTIWMFYSGGLDYFNLDFRKVYQFRDDVGEAINQGVMTYLNTWAMKIFGPMLLAIGLWKKKYTVVMLVLVLHVVWFGISSHKAVLFYPFLVVFLWMWFRNSKALAFLPLGMAFVVLISFMTFLIWDNLLIASLLVRRVFFVPSMLTFTYYEFFSENEFVYWSSSITSAWIHYPYEMDPAKLIGVYLGTDAHANNSFLATGYMHAGVSGIIFYCLIAGLLFRLIDSLSNKGVPSWVALASLIVPAHSLIGNADLLTAMLTHGIGVAIVILFLLRSAPSRIEFQFVRGSHELVTLQHRKKV